MKVARSKALLAKGMASVDAAGKQTVGCNCLGARAGCFAEFVQVDVDAGCEGGGAGKEPGQPAVAAADVEDAVFWFGEVGL